MHSGDFDLGVSKKARKWGDLSEWIKQNEKYLILNKSWITMNHILKLSIENNAMLKWLSSIASDFCLTTKPLGFTVVDFSDH